MTFPEWLHPFDRTFPSANMALIRGKNPVLVDTGFGSDFSDTVRLLEDTGVPPAELTLIANTHYHCDHVGGNHHFQHGYGIPIAAYHSEAKMINNRDRDACAGEWLHQPVEPYHIDRMLFDDDEIDAGGVVLRVLHTPGHTLGHISFYAPDDGVLICGDAFHNDDVAWLNVFREGVGAVYRMMETLDRLAKLPLKLSFSGHSPPTSNPLEAIDRARRRYEKWLHQPEKIGWHACKRIFTYALMLSDGMTETESARYLLESPWYLDYCRYVFDSDPGDFAGALLAEISRSGAGVWQGGKLMPVAPYNPPSNGWYPNPVFPKVWGIPDDTS